MTEIHNWPEGTRLVLVDDESMNAPIGTMATVQTKFWGQSHEAVNVKWDRYTSSKRRQGDGGYRAARFKFAAHAPDSIRSSAKQDAAYYKAITEISNG